MSDYWEYTFLNASPRVSGVEYGLMLTTSTDSLGLSESEVVAEGTRHMREYEQEHGLAEDEVLVYRGRMRFRDLPTPSDGTHHADCDLGEDHEDGCVRVVVISQEQLR